VLSKTFAIAILLAESKGHSSPSAPSTKTGWQVHRRMVERLLSKTVR